LQSAECRKSGASALCPLLSAPWAKRVFMDCQTWNLIAGASGVLIGLVFAWFARRHAVRQIERMAFHDPLTDLPNRILFMDRAANAFAHAKRAGSKVAIVYLDLDRFKLINDSFGHNTGDEVLRGVARRLREQIREVDTVARMGGDEFTLIMTGVYRPDDAVRIASKLLDVFRLPLALGDREFVVTSSIGMSIYPDDGSDAESLVNSADAAMYQAKKRGGDNFQMYTRAMDVHAREELELEARLRHAIARQEFVLHYQPRVDSATARVVAFEALVRWNDPERGLLMPGDFIHSAEVSGLIIPIGEWVLHAACQQAAQWHREGCHTLVVSVNLSVRQFHRPDLTTTIKEALREAGLEPQFLELEIDESCVMDNAEASMRILKDLKAIGVRVLMSRFGAGYSSLRYLRRFPIDGLKLDRSFLAPNGGDNRPLATAALGMAKALRLKIIGEGVETQEAADFLRLHSCDDIQGFIVSEAVPAQACERFIRLTMLPPPGLDGSTAGL
jgi:diguanylate cyclase (GGDEF)-like protein